MSAKIKVPRGGEVKLLLDEVEHDVMVLDIATDVILLRIGDELAEREHVYDVTLRYGLNEFQWEVPCRLVATYGDWWFLERPLESECQRIQRREFVRIGYETTLMGIPADQYGRHLGEPKPFITTNLSAGGCLAVSAERLGQVGEHLMVLLELPGLPSMSALATIVRASEDGALKNYGLHFAGLKGQAQDRMVQFVASQLRDELAKGQRAPQRQGVAS